MATFNLIRNSRVLFTTNVNATTGIVDTTTAQACTAANTQEITVLDGFTFSQGTGVDTIQISEAGAAPSRGERAFNTALNPVDFSFSTYLKPVSQDTVRCEESHLWNALFGTTALTDTGIAIAFTGTPAGTVAAAGASTPATYTIVGTTLTTTLVTNDIITLKGVAGANANELNTQYKVASTSATTIVLNFLSPPETVTGVAGVFTATQTLWGHKTSFVSQPAVTLDTAGTIVGVNKVAGASYAEITTVRSNVNQLLPFGMIMIVDNITYVIDNCAFDQAQINFDLAGVATVQWTGKGTALRQLSTSITFTNPTPVTVSGVVTTAPSIGNITTTTTATATTTVALASALPVGTVIRAGGDIIGVVGTLAAAAQSTILLAAVASRAVTAVAATATLPVVLTAGITGQCAPRFSANNYITNKLSTASLQLGIAGSGTTNYVIPLTGGTITVANNINYVTPANIGVVNQPIGYYTGTRAITGNLTAYLRTGTTGTGALLSALLTGAATTTETKYELGVQIGGAVTATRVEILASGCSLQIPAINSQSVLATTINFTVQGFEAFANTGANFDLEAVNDMRVRYFSV